MLAVLLLFLIQFYPIPYAQAEISAESCPTVRLDGEDGPFSKIPVYQQNLYMPYDPGICYAVTAAQGYDAERFYRGDRGLKKLSSPYSFGVALAQQQKRGIGNMRKYLFDGRKQSLGAMVGAGDVAWAFVSVSRASKDPFICDQSWLNSVFPLAREGDVWFGSSANFTCGGGAEAFARFIAKAPGALVPSYLSDLPAIKGEAVITLIQAVSEALASSGDLDSLEAFLQRFCAHHSLPVPSNLDTESTRGMSRDQIEAFQVAVGEAYRDRRMHPYLEMRAEKSQNLGKKVGELLTRKPYPKVPMLQYDPKVLVAGEPGPGLPTHASVIIGQKFNVEKQTCEFLLRDSYGPDCKYDFESIYTCENGSHWIPAGRLMDFTDQVIWVKDGQ